MGLRVYLLPVLMGMMLEWNVLLRQSATALMVHFAWCRVHQVSLFGKAELNSVTTISGALSVMIAGVPLMLVLHAGSLDSPPMVRKLTFCTL